MGWITKEDCDDYWRERIRNNAIASFCAITIHGRRPEEFIELMFPGPHLDYFEEFVQKGAIHQGSYTIGMRPRIRKRCRNAIGELRELWKSEHAG